MTYLFLLALDNAYLAQSPQLYKQMAIAADFERVFTVGAGIGQTIPCSQKTNYLISSLLLHSIRCSL